MQPCAVPGVAWATRSTPALNTVNSVMVVRGSLVAGAGTQRFGSLWVNAASPGGSVPAASPIDDPVLRREHLRIAKFDANGGEEPVHVAQRLRPLHPCWCEHTGPLGAKQCLLAYVGSPVPAAKKNRCCWVKRPAGMPTSNLRARGRGRRRPLLCQIGFQCLVGDLNPGQIGLVLSDSLWPLSSRLDQVA